MCKAGSEKKSKTEVTVHSAFYFIDSFPLFPISLISIIMYLRYASVQFMKHCYLLYVKHPVLNMVIMK